MFGTAIQVPAEYSQMRLWRNTSIADLQPGQVATLANGTLGYEWDEDVDNGFRPAGLINMSSTTENVPEKIVDPISWPGCGGCPAALCATCRGCAVAPGTATHTLTLYRAPSGALVFGAGTIQWSWGLDGTHDGGATTPDLRMQQATVNLFADMGVQPARSSPGWSRPTMSTDLIRPTSTITSPAGGATFVGRRPGHDHRAPRPTAAAASSAGVEVSTDGGQTWRKATGPAELELHLDADHDRAGHHPEPGGRRQREHRNPRAGSRPVDVTSTADQHDRAGRRLQLQRRQRRDRRGRVRDATTGHRSPSATWTAGGMFGSEALSFDGINDWVTIADSELAGPDHRHDPGGLGQADRRSTGYGTSCSRSGPAGESYALYAVDTDRPRTPRPRSLRRAAGTTPPPGSALLPLNAWSHLAATYDGSTLLAVRERRTWSARRRVTGSITTSNGRPADRRQLRSSATTSRA